MSDVEVSIPFSKFSAANNRKLITVNNNNILEDSCFSADGKFSELKSRSVSPRSMSANGESIRMSPESIAQRSIERHSPYKNGPISPPRSTNSLSPSSAASPRTMSPPTEHRSAVSYASDGYHPNYIGSIASYQTSVPPKKSFCIDALLSKNSQHTAIAGQHSPETIRYLSEEEAAHKYSDDNREYASSPDDMNSR